MYCWHGKKKIQIHENSLDKDGPTNESPRVCARAPMHLPVHVCVCRHGVCVCINSMTNFCRCFTVPQSVCTVHRERKRFRYTRTLQTRMVLQTNHHVGVCVRLCTYLCMFVYAGMACVCVCLLSQRD